MKIYLNENEFVTKTELNKITRRKLENNITRSYPDFCENYSLINGREYRWEYRHYDGIFCPVCDKEDAELIYVTDDLGNRIKEIRF